MNPTLRQKVIEARSDLNSQRIANSTEFYFQKAKDALQYFLQIEVSEESKNFLLARRKDYHELKQLFEDSQDLLPFGNAIFKVISYCDAKAHRKNEFNDYEDKRVLALASVRMNNWVEQLITYKFEKTLVEGSIKNAVEYLLNPIDHFTMLSENHRSQICQNLFKKPFEKTTFKKDVVEFFSDLSFPVKHPENYTHLLTRICYAIWEEWKDSVIGLVSPDRTDWKEGAISDSSSGEHIVLWNHKKPVGTTNTLKLLRQCIEDDGFFRIFYTSSYQVHYIAEIVDFAVNQQELDQANWSKLYNEISWYQDKLSDYKGDGKVASWVYLARKIEKVNPNDYQDFQYYKSNGYPSVGNQSPVVSYKSHKEVNYQNQMDKIISILRYKKQIILQGPPGTGKTKLAKEVARALSFNNISINKTYIKMRITQLMQSEFKVGNLTILKVNEDDLACLRGGDSESFSVTFDELYDCYDSQDYLKSDFVNYPQYATRILVQCILDGVKPMEGGTKQIEIIQFHPSYTYEDFVRGIVAIPNEDGDGILYKAENKLLGTFAEQALNNFLTSKGESQSHSIFQSKLYGLLDSIRDKIEAGSDYSFGSNSTGKIIAIKEDGLLYNFPSREDIKYKILFSDLEKVFNSRGQIEKPIDLRDLEKIIGLEMRGKYPYYYMLLKQLETIQVKGVLENKQDPKNYVLVIDEINRANLSSILGELIYALEYRGKEVDSLYKVNGSNKLILPPNLYIIGTMNTADRSVGHIDYAIRRRFAFVELLPKNLQQELGDDFKAEIFNVVAGLFVKNFNPEMDYSANAIVIEKSDYLNTDFDPKDVWLGHSYFIQQYETDENGEPVKERPINFSLRIQYEIKPILEEYVKDGILKESAKAIINQLN